MLAWQVERLGPPPEVLRLADVPEPAVEAGTVKIRVEAAALNFLDILLCLGQYQERPPLPFTPGAEVAGTVIEAGPGATFKVGERVMALPVLPRGGLAERVVVPEDRVYPVAPGMPATDAAAFLIAFHTADYALRHRARLQPGEVLLVHAGAGGVGSAAIQLGVAMGARVLATAGGAEKVDLCRRLGAELAVDYRQQDFVEAVKEATGGRGADVIFDPVGGDAFDRSRRCVAPEGRILVIGFAGGGIPQVPANHVLVKNYSVVGIHWGYRARLQPAAVRDDHLHLLDLYRRGTIRPVVFREYGFDRLVEALDDLAGRRSYGKLVLRRAT
ncbi:NADPH:quinone oxidoreductase family protein [Thermaerobacter sp. PB12/4term]|uniref:NADPH:quinone oxidoreductase family protein n=1 Tax=Thermaerobacter sp. PB12/4term TaxID=2293838 RepID=UPI000E32A0E9|nr:NADPH:quinone oxidoreductase family protein [Thermaerobacter sp. PB12/4term]QIA27656.1 NADPH:quinone oxidoreductase family protein [Thermaerobacter sp. PB12/4term]